MKVTSDIDFMVSQSDFDRLPSLLSSFSKRHGLQFIQAFDHETSARYYILAKLDDEGCVYLHPDSSSDYRRNGRKCLDAKGVLERRRLHPRGFWIPAPADAFDYYIVKRVDKGLLTDKHGDHLSRLYAEDPEGCSRAISKRWPTSAEKIRGSAISNDWSGVTASLSELGKELFATWENEPVGSLLMELTRKCRRVLAPSGCWIAFLGPDGSGKSSLIEALTQLIQPAFRKVHSYHLRPRLLLTGRDNVGSGVADPHGKPSRSLFVSLGKLAIFCGDYICGYWLRIRPQMVRSTLVIFDRYYSDLLVDPKRYRYKAPRWITRLMAGLVPLPDLIFVLDAPPEVLQTRKQEVSFEECRRQREAYANLAVDLRQRTQTVVIDASQPFDDSVSDVAEEIFRFLGSRMAHRFDKH